MSARCDVVVVGSGPAGVNAAWPLAEKGLRVTLVDVGGEDRVYGPLIPSEPWSRLRRTDPDQHRYFLGDNFEGVPLDGERVGAQLTPPRQHIVRTADDLLPLEGNGFQAVRGLATGGLGVAWGAGAFPFADSELRGLPIGESDLEPHYERIYARIGVAGEAGDLEPFLGASPSLLPPLELDRNSEVILERYTRGRGRLNRRGWFMGRPHLAVCSETFRGRGPMAYHDMEFWADTDRSVYRPRWTLEELEGRSGFKYEPGWVAEQFREGADGEVVLSLRSVEGGERRTLRSRALVLAAGTLESARIALRSFGLYGHSVPLLTNPYTYAPVLNLGMLGQEERDRRHSLAQLTGILAPEGASGALTQVQYYTYRSLLGFKLAKEMPLRMPVALQLARTLTPLLGIVAINHEDRPSPEKACVLVKVKPGDGAFAVSDTCLRIDYVRSKAEERARRKAERRVLRAFVQLGCLPLRMLRLPPGSSIHYAGTLPMGRGPEPLTTNADGRLARSRSVYVADGSIFRHLPAKGLTFTIMAHADRVGTLLSARLLAGGTG